MPSSRDTHRRLDSDSLVLAWQAVDTQRGDDLALARGLALALDVVLDHLERTVRGGQTRPVRRLLDGLRALGVADPAEYRVGSIPASDVPATSEMLNVFSAMSLYTSMQGDR